MLEHSLEILVNIDTYDVTHPSHHISVVPIYWDVVTGGHARTMNSLSYPRNQFEISVHAGRSQHDNMGHCGHKGCPWSATILRYIGTFLNDVQSVLKDQKYPPCLYAITSLNRYCVEVKLWPEPSECHNSSNQATFFWSSIVQAWWVSAKCPVPSWQEQHLMCWPICSKVQCVLHSSYLVCNHWLFEFLPPSCQLPAAGQGKNIYHDIYIWKFAITI